MHETPEAEFSPSSPIKTTLIVVGALAGLMLLVCGGAAGYVALTAPAGREEQAPEAADDPSLPADKMQKMKEQIEARRIRLTEDPALVRKIAARICEIDLPAGFEPIEAYDQGGVRVASFGNVSENGALLKLAQIDWPMSIEGITDLDNMMQAQVLSAAEKGDGRIDTTLKASRQKPESIQRELMVLGQKVEFVFRKGKRASGNQRVWKTRGAFAAKQGGVALVLMVPESEFDEESIVRMIESIHLAGDEEPEADGKSESRPTQPGKTPATRAEATDSN